MNPGTRKTQKQILTEGQEIAKEFFENIPHRIKQLQEQRAEKESEIRALTSAIVELMEVRDNYKALTNEP